MAGKRRTAKEQHAEDVAAYVAAGGEESVQRVITAVYGLTKKLDQWYNRQFADLDLGQGEWTVLTSLAKAGDNVLTPSRLAEIASVAPSSMTHRLDKMEARGLVVRRPDRTNRTRTLVSLTKAGRDLFGQAVREANVVEGDTLRGLTDTERRELARLLEIVIAGLDEVDA